MTAPTPEPTPPNAPSPQAPATPPAAPSGTPATPPAPTYVPPPQMTPAAPAAPAAPAQPQYVPVIPTPRPPAEPDDAGKDWSKLPQWAQTERQKLVDEAAQRRISERTAVVNQHAYIAAGQLGANPAALLGSVAFGELAKALTPSDADFPGKLTEAIRTVMAANPWMAAAPAPASPVAPPLPPPPTSGADFASVAAPGGPVTEAQLAQMTPAQIDEAFKAGKLRHLLT